MASIGVADTRFYPMCVCVCYDAAAIPTVKMCYFHIFRFIIKAFIAHINFTDETHISLPKLNELIAFFFYLFSSLSLSFSKHRNRIRLQRVPDLFKLYTEHINLSAVNTEMANPIFNSCLGRQSLRTGSVIAGVGAILLSIVFIIMMFALRFKPKTILFDWLPPGIVKVIIAFNLCMTILISIIMIVGAVKVIISFFF